MKKLSELKIGESGIIETFAKEDYHLKLLEMGCIPGEKVSVEQVALSGDPISIYISGYNLSLRKEEADSILVKTTGI